jgi:3-hydroxyisobutyrate dehydrogenase-like beta-hydroxyacid dehydrogenase
MQNGIMKVGFIGLGHMGTAMVGRLLQGGHEVTVYNRTLHARLSSRRWDRRPSTSAICPKREIS